MDEKMFGDACISFSESFEYLNSECGLIGTDQVHYDLQLTAEQLYKIARKFRRRINIENDGSDYWPYRYSINIKGKVFFALGRESTLAAEVKRRGNL